MVFEQHAVAQQAGARMQALEEVVTEQGVVGHDVVQGALEGGDVVDALADERPAPEQILVDVGDRARVRIEAGGGREQGREARAAGAQRADLDARLQDRVALDDPVRGRIELGAVERVGERPGQLLRRVARQIGVGVEHDDETDRGEKLAVADVQLELPTGHVGLPALGSRGAQDEPVELDQLAAFALPSHPAPFARIPASPSMQQLERASAVGAVSPVERGDAVDGAADQLVIRRQVLTIRVDQIGHQRELQLGIAVGEVADLQSFEQGIDLVDIREQRRNRDQRPPRRGDAAGEVEFRQHARPQQAGQHEVDQRDGHADDRNQADDDGKDDDRHGGVGQQPGGQRGRRAGAQPADRSEVGRGRIGGQPTPPALAPARARTERPFELASPGGRQIVTDMPAPRIVGAPGQADGRRRHRFLVGVGGPRRDHLDDLAVAVAGVEVHLLVRRRRILGEDAFDGADALEELLPVRHFEGAQAADGAGDHAPRFLLALTLRRRVGRGGNIARRESQPFEQRQPQHGRQRPQLGDGQGACRLQVADGGGDGVGIDAALAGGDQLARHYVGQRQAAQLAVRHQTQAALEADRKFLLQAAHGPLQDVVVVEQPFGRARALERGARHGGKPLVGGLDGAFGGADAGDQARAARAARCQRQRRQPAQFLAAQRSRRRVRRRRVEGRRDHVSRRLARGASGALSSRTAAPRSWRMMTGP